MNITQAKWIAPAASSEGCPLFLKSFTIGEGLASACLEITAAGVYEAHINGKRVSDYILAPGWTDYRSRLQVQSYDVTGLLAEENELTVALGVGWCFGRISRERVPEQGLAPGLLASLTLRYADGAERRIVTDEDWSWRECGIVSSDIYDGEVYDANRTGEPMPVKVVPNDMGRLLPQQGEEIREQEVLRPVRSFVTPKGERVLDFGQEITGYVSFTVEAKRGDRVVLSHAEVMDKEGCFYTENYRSAQSKVTYTCSDGVQTYKPHLTFYGFRYIRVDEAPAGMGDDCFSAIVIHSQMTRTGFLTSSSPMLNRLFDNILWGQKGNFVDVPTDCPQRDERLGWTGDAQVFIKTATYLFDTERFYTKWLADVAAEQEPDGMVPFVVPNTLPGHVCSAAWADAAVICPWQVYMTYGHPEILERQFDSMKAWVDCITANTSVPNLWINDEAGRKSGINHFGDWLGLDAPEGSYKGSSNDDLIASAYYAYDCGLLVRAGKALDRDMSEYEALHERIVKACQATFNDPKTQTECVLLLHFGLCDDRKSVAAKLAALIAEVGTHLTTGFVGTPYLLHALTDNGYGDVAWSLLLREEYPSWLYSITKGATTIWEHWDGIKPDGSFWDDAMNSYNHYSYGAVADWVVEKACGIQPQAPGFARLRVEPHPDARVQSLRAELHTAAGRVVSGWRWENGVCRFEVEVPVEAEIAVNGRTYAVKPGSYWF